MKSTKRINPVIKTSVPIALNSPIVNEDLPLPFVHYPNHYGAFIGFSETNQSKIFFCKCALSAIENHFSLNSLELKNTWSDERISAPLSSHFFPNQIAIESLNNGEINKIINYKEKICHRCNLASPSLRYCHEMYGGNFKQYFGWYIRQTFLRLGIRDFNYIPDITPDNFIEVIREGSNLNDLRKSLSLNNYTYSKEIFGKISDIDKKISNINKKLYKEIENITREEFGFRKIGEGNVSETILTKIVCKLFLNVEILKHHRPQWLGGLELDIFIPSKRIGIEYQGQQHFHPIQAWGGDKALEKLRERDHKKRNICKENNVQLIEFDYTEPLELSYVKKKVYSYMSE